MQILKKIIKLILKPLLNRINNQSQRIEEIENKLQEIENKKFSTKAEIEILTETLSPISYVPKNNGKSHLVSIIMPTYNRANIITQAIESIKSITFKNWELIIVDDGSEDKTEEIIKDYLDDSRIKYFIQKKQGVSSARNLGLKMSNGDYIAYLDSDNLMYPNFISYAVNFMSQNDEIDIIYGAIFSKEHSKTKKEFEIFFHQFNRELLLKTNYIDINSVVYRKKLFSMHGGFDISLDRLTDWDLILRYTSTKEAKFLPVLAAYYRKMDDIRISDNALAGPSYIKILNKNSPVITPNFQPKILYILWHYPQLSEQYIECEIKQLERWGCNIEIWREVKPLTPYDSSITIHEGDLREILIKVKPDVIHIHWISFANKISSYLINIDIPITIRLHGFDTTSELINSFIEKPNVKAIYGYPQHLLDIKNSKLKVMTVAFDTVLFKPNKNKNKKLVVRAGAALPTKCLTFFIHLAKELPDFKFVLALVKCNEFDSYADELISLASKLNSPVEIKINLSHKSVANLISDAGIYLHTLDSKIIPTGMPISIAEAMATGSYIVASNDTSIKNFIGEAGGFYDDLADAKNLINKTKEWTEDDWERAFKKSADRAFLNYTDEFVYREMFNDWAEFAKQDCIEIN